MNAKINNVYADVKYDVVILYFSAESESGREHVDVNSGNGGGGALLLKLRLLSH